MDAKGNVGPCKSFLVLNTLTQIITEPQSCSTKLPVLNSLQKRSPVYIDECQKCSAIGTCGNACAYEAWVQSGDMMSRDMRACNYTQLFFQKFIDDLAEIVKAEVENSSFYEPTKSDRLKLLGKIVVNEDTLSSSIGHAADE
jgi:radical SAM protein with 4Fe4S-binding SPASM domain